MEQTYKNYKNLNLRIGAALLLFLILITAAGAIYSIPMFVELFRSPEMGFDSEIPELAELLKKMEPVFAVFDIVWEVIYGGMYLFSFMIAVPFFYLISKGKKTESLHLRFKLSPRLPLFILAGIGLNFVFAYINYYLTLPFNLDQLTGDIMSTDMKIYEVILQMIVTAMVPAFCEEFLFRGMILSNLLPYGKGTALVISATCFALMHQNPGQLLYTFVAGLMLGYVFIESGSIWGGIIFHFLNNLISVIEQFIIAKNPIYLAEFYDSLLVIGIMLVGMMCTLILLTSYLARKKKEKHGEIYDVNDGIFEKEFAIASNSLGERLPRGKKIAGFLSPTMIIFIVMTVSSMLGIILLGLMV